MENPIKMGWFGGTNIFENIHIGVSHRGTLVRGMTLAEQNNNSEQNHRWSTGDQTASKMGHEAPSFGYGGMEFLVCVEKLTFDLRSK